MSKEPLFPPLFQSITVAFDVDRSAMVEDPVKDRRSDHMVAEDLTPLPVGLV